MFYISIDLTKPYRSSYFRHNSKWASESWTWLLNSGESILEFIFFEGILMKERNLPLIIFNYMVVYIVWGSTYFFIKIAVSSIPPFHVIGLRFFTGGLFFLLIILLSGRMKSFPSIKEILASAFLGLMLLLGGTGLVTIAEKNTCNCSAYVLVFCHQPWPCTQNSIWHHRQQLHPDALCWNNLFIDYSHYKANNNWPFPYVFP